MPDTDPYLVPKSPADKIQSIAQVAGVSSDVADDYLKLTHIESGQNQNVRASSKGARGFGQVMPDVKGGTVRTVGGRKYDLTDESQNIEAGLKYFAQGGDDPVGRRLYYFGGPGAKAHYQKTGQIPNISDGNMTAAQYVAATGGHQAKQAPQDPYLVPKPTTTETTGDPYLVPKDAAQPSIVDALKGLTDSTNRVTRRMVKRLPAPESAPSLTPNSQWGGALVDPSLKEAQAKGEIRNRVIRDRDIANQSELGQTGALIGTPSLGAGNILGHVEQVLHPIDTLNRLFTPEEDQIKAETERQYQAQQRASTPEMIQARKKFGALSPTERGLSSIPATLYSDVLKTGAGAAQAASVLTGLPTQRITDYLNAKGNLFKEAQSLPPLSAEGEEIKRKLPEKLVSTLGEMGVGLGELILTKKATGLSMAKIMGLEAALKSSDLPIRERGAKVTEATAMGRILDGHLGRIESAALFGVPTAVQSGVGVARGQVSPEDALLQTGLQSATGLVLGGKPKGVEDARQTETQRQGVSAEQPTESNSTRSGDIRDNGRAVSNAGTSLPKGNLPVGDASAAALPEASSRSAQSDELPVVPEHHSANQLRRARNTEHGNKGQFKAGKVEPVQDVLDQGGRPSNEVPVTNEAVAQQPKVQSAGIGEETKPVPETESSEAISSLEHEVRDAERALRLAPKYNTTTGKIRPDYEALERTYKNAAVAAEAVRPSVNEAQPAAIPPIETKPNETLSAAPSLPDTKAVDHEGKPIVVYHGSTEPFDAFEFRPTYRNIDNRPTEVTPSAHYFSTDKDTASMFARDKMQVNEKLRKASAGTETVRPYYLDVQNPIDFTITDETRQQMMRDGFDPYYNPNAPNPYAVQEIEEITGYQPESWDDIQQALDDPSIMRELKRRGYDGARLQENDGSETWAAFDAKQIHPAAKAEQSTTLQEESGNAAPRASEIKDSALAPAKEPPVSPSTPVQAVGETAAPVSASKLKERSFPKTLASTGREGGADRIYNEFTDKESRARADARIAKDPQSAAEYVLQGNDAPETTAGKERIATGLKLADQLSTEAEGAKDPVEAATKHAQAIDLYTKLSQDLTTAGQTVQAASQAKRYSITGAPLEVVRIAKRQGVTPKAEDISLVREMAKKQGEFESRLADVQKQIDTLKAQKPTIKTTQPKAPRPKVPTLIDRLATMEAEARASLKARAERAQVEIAGPKGQRGAAVNPADVAASIVDWTKIGAIKIARGGLNFAAWSKEMVDEFGDAVRPHLNKIFLASHKLVTEQRATLKEGSAVRSAVKGAETAGRREAWKPGGEHQQGPYASPKSIEDLRQERYEIQVQKRQNRLDMDRKFNQLERSQGAMVKTTGMVSTILRDGLLSFHGLFNILSGMTAKQAIDTAARIPEATLDIARVRGAQMIGKAVPRTAAGLSIKGLTATTKSFATQGAKNVGKALAGKSSEVMPHVHEGPFDNPYANAAIGPMGRLYGAKESLIRSWALPSERQNQASVMAHNDVLDGVIKRSELNARIDDYLNGRAEVTGKRNQMYVDSLSKQAANYEARNKDIIPSAKDMRARELASNPTQLIDSLARQYADRQVYANPSLIAEGVTGAKGGIARVSPAAGRVVEIAQAVAMPFVKRPSNAIIDLLNTYTGARVPIEAVRNSFTKLGGEHWSPAEIKSFNQALARGGAGPALFAMGYALAGRGMLTSQNDKKNPGALKIGNDYYSISRVPVIGWLLTAGATAKKDGGKAVPGAIAKMISEHPLLRSVKQASDAMTEGVQVASGKTGKVKAAATSFAGKTIGRVVPTPVAATAETMDTRQRDDRGLLGPAMSRIPFLRQRLPATGTKGRFSAFDPFKPPAIRLKARTGGSALKFK